MVRRTEASHSDFMIINKGKENPRLEENGMSVAKISRDFQQACADNEVKSSPLQSLCIIISWNNTEGKKGRHFTTMEAQKGNGRRTPWPIHQHALRRSNKNTRYSDASRQNS